MERNAKAKNLIRPSDTAAAAKEPKAVEEQPLAAPPNVNTDNASVQQETSPVRRKSTAEKGSQEKAGKRNCANKLQEGEKGNGNHR